MQRSAECLDGPLPSEYITTGGGRVGIALGQDSKCMLLFLPSECKLFLILLSDGRGKNTHTHTHIHQCPVARVNGCSVAPSGERAGHIEFPGGHISLS